MDYRYIDRAGAISDSASSGKNSPLTLDEWSPPSTSLRLRDAAFVNLDQTSVERWVLELVPESVARENCVLPLDYDGETLKFACLDANDINLADKLRFMLAKNVELLRAREADILDAINRYYGQIDGESADSMLQDFADEDYIDFTETADAAAPIDLTCSEPRFLTRGGQAMKQRHATDTRRKNRAMRITPQAERTTSMFLHTVEEGERALFTHRNGKKQLVVGPQRIWGWFSRIEPLHQHIAHPGQFLIVHYRDGTQKHLPGPAEVWFDPREHQQITFEDCLQIGSKEAVVVYSRDPSVRDDKAGNVAETADVSRRILTGPALFVPQPGEWLHTFSWHASKGGHLGVEKKPNSLVFQKLWLMPDQMYHDVPDVRTADNAVLTIRLMVFFELTDVDRMLDATHDPIGDFVNAATADIVEFTGKHDFESFKQNTDRLNDLATYKTLTDRAQQVGYRINNVVYRGYGAADSLQKMHDQAIEARTRLQLDRATEEQTQDLENYRLESQLARAATRREQQTDEVRHEMQLNDEKQQAELQRQQARQEFLREQRDADAQLQEQITTRQAEQQQSNLRTLGDLGVDLTAYLTQTRADQVIEVRGGNGSAPQMHIDSSISSRNAPQPTNGAPRESHDDQS